MLECIIVLKPDCTRLVQYKEPIVHVTSTISRSQNCKIKKGTTRFSTEKQMNMNAKSNLASLTCPNCRLINPASAMYCDCGHDFMTNLTPHKTKSQELSKWETFFALIHLLVPIILLAREGMLRTKRVKSLKKILAVHFVLGLTCICMSQDPFGQLKGTANRAISINLGTYGFSLSNSKEGTDRESMVRFSGIQFSHRVITSNDQPKTSTESFHPFAFGFGFKSINF